MHPNQWVHRLCKVMGEGSLTLIKAGSKFDTSAKSIQLNSSCISNPNNDMKKVLSKEEETTVGHGSEFQVVNQLRKIISDHRNSHNSLIFFKMVILSKVCSIWKSSMLLQSQLAQV